MATREDETSRESERDGDPAEEQGAAGAPDEGAAPEREMTVREREEAATQIAGPERYVLFGFVALAAVAMWLFDKIIARVWDEFAEPPPVLVLSIAALAAVILAVSLYATPRIRTLASEIAVELGKVTWPTRKETYYATVVVIVTSIIAAIIVSAFDAVWSSITDLIYKV
ncbi:MAG: preprotein translocase subunit SecE [Myxococcota bacterium]|nr:preprotein translocase subunit SecE [Myxococcota bacterium]MDW8361668.1 preprotein translocase subunit SecE [Myxococcales bacterium]